MDDKVRLLQTLHDLYTVYYRLDGLCDSVLRAACSVDRYALEF